MRARKGDPAERFVRPDVRAIAAYEEEALPGGLNLSNNTNLFGVNPAIERALGRARPEAFWDYPSLASTAFRRAVSRAFPSVAEDMVVTGNGSNDLIDLIVRACASPGDRVAFHPPTFSMIPFFVRTNRAEPVPVPLRGAFALDVEGILAADALVTFVCRPNNPTGNAFARKDVERLLDATENLVVVDEAYAEFTDDRSFIGEVATRDNLVVLRTLSKGHGLAGFRIGYAVAPSTLAREIGKVRGPFRLNALSELVGVAALDDPSFVRESAAAVRAERPRLAALFEAHGFHVFPSDANFLLVRPPVDARELAAALARRGVHVRDFAGDLAPFLRVTVGPATATQRVATVLEDALREAAAKGGGDTAG